MNEIKRRKIEKYGGYLFKVMAIIILVTLVYRFFFHVTTSEENSLIGKWKYHQIFKDGKDITKSAGLRYQNWIIISADSTFTTNDGADNTSKGKWNYDENSRLLSLDDPEIEGDEQYWIVTFLHNKIKLSGMADRKMEEYELILVRE